jgi:hypothetical protein
MRRLALVFLLSIFVVAADARAQSDSPSLTGARQAAYFELGGSAVVPSINYERRLRGDWHGRVGFSVVTGETSEDTETTFVVPLTVSSVNRPEANHHLELGGGFTLVTGDSQDFWETVDDDEQVSNVFLTGIAGYRYQRPQGGFQFRAVLTPIIGSGVAAPWFGVSFGYAW